MQKILLPKGDFIFLPSGDANVLSRVPNIRTLLNLGDVTPLTPPRSHRPVKIDSDLSTLKLLHIKSTTDVYEYLMSEKGL